MSTNSNQFPTLAEDTASEYEHYIQLAEKCMSIVKKFHDKQMPIAPKDFKEMLFYTLHDAYVHKDDSAVNDDHVFCIYFLWEVLAEIEELGSVISN